MTIFDTLKYPIKNNYNSKDLANLPSLVYWHWVTHRDYCADPVKHVNQDNIRYYSKSNINLLRKIILELNVNHI